MWPRGRTSATLQPPGSELGPADITTYSPTAEELSASGFETMRFVDATYHGTTRTLDAPCRAYRPESSIPRNRSLEQHGRHNRHGNGRGVSQCCDPIPCERHRRVAGDAKGRAGRNRTLHGRRHPRIWTSSTNAAGLPVKRLVRTKGVYAGQTYELRLLVNGEATETSEYTVPAGDVIPDGNMENPGLSCFTQENQNAEFWASGNNGFAKELCTSAAFDGMGGAPRPAESLGSPDRGTGRGQPDVRHLLQRRSDDRRRGIRAALHMDGTPLRHESKVPCDGRHRQSGKTQRSADRQGRSGQGPDLRGNRRLECPSPGSFGKRAPRPALGTRRKPRQRTRARSSPAVRCSSTVRPPATG